MVLTCKEKSEHVAQRKTPNKQNIESSFHLNGLDLKEPGFDNIFTINVCEKTTVTAISRNAMVQVSPHLASLKNP